MSGWVQMRPTSSWCPAAAGETRVPQRMVIFIITHRFRPEGRLHCIHNNVLLSIGPIARIPSLFLSYGNKQQILTWWSGPSNEYLLHRSVRIWYRANGRSKCNCRPGPFTHTLTKIKRMRLFLKEVFQSWETPAGSASYISHLMCGSRTRFYR